MRTKGQREEMPAEGNGWVKIDAGPSIDVLFHPNRQLEGHEPDGVIRKSIDVAVAGKREQALRFDPFSMGAHYHIAPMPGEGQIELKMAEGQTPLAAALAFFENHNTFCGMLMQAERGSEPFNLPTAADLERAAAQIRAINARAAT